MMRRRLARGWMVLALLVPCAAVAADPAGLVTLASRYTAVETVSKLEAVLQGAGMTIFARIDHAAAAEKAGLRMRPAHVLIFGNPKGGTPMMQRAPTSAIDLPMKALVWEDEAGRVWLSYNSGTYVAQRHELKGMDDAVRGLDGALGKLTAKALE